MAKIREWFARVCGMFRHTRTDGDLEQELRLHLDLAFENGQRGSDSSSETSRAAHLQSGGLTFAMDALRDQRGVPWLTDLLRDLRFGWQMLTRHKAFTTVTVATLALGVGANIAVFSITDALLLRPSIFPYAQRVYWVLDTNSWFGQTAPDVTLVSPRNFLNLRRETRAFDYMVAWQNWHFSISGPGSGDALQAQGVRVSPAFFQMLGVNPSLGRTLRNDEEQPGHDRVVVISDSLWKRFGSDVRILGRTVHIDGLPYSIVGVLPSDFFFEQRDYDVWMPMTVDAAFAADRTSHSVSVLARLAPGVSLRAAQAELDRLVRALETEYSEANAGWGGSLLSPFNPDLRPTLLLLFAAVGCLLLITCLNVGNLLLVRTSGRSHEIAIRASIGASRGRLIRQMLTESTLLAGMAAAGGVLLAAGILTLIVPFVSRFQVAGPLTLGINARVFAFALGVGCVTSVVFGVFPAVHASHTQNLESAALGRVTAGRALLIAEIAGSLMLLITSMLLIKSVWNLQRVDLGFRSERLLTMEIWLPTTTYSNAPEVSTFYQELLRRLHRIPEIRDTALVNTRPFLGWSIGERVQMLDRPADGEPPLLDLRVVSPEYLATMTTPLVKGRMLTNHDTSDQPGVAFVNEAMVARYWPERDPVGSTIRIQRTGPATNAPWRPILNTDTFTIVGVSADIREGRPVPVNGSRLRDKAAPTVYLSYLQDPSRYMNLMVRTTLRAEDAAGLVKKEIQSIDPSLGVSDERTTMGDVVSDEIETPRLTAVLLSVFASIAVLLSAIGVYGVISHAVSQRSREFAIRIALGAPTLRLFKMVMQDALLTAGLGIVVGLAGAVVLSRTMTRFLYGIVPNDGATLTMATGAIFVVALLAGLMPAWRATRVDPLTILRAI